MVVKRTWQVVVDRSHTHYGYFEKITRLSNNLSNAVRFRQRQLVTATGKESSLLTDNERGVHDEFLRYTGTDYSGKGTVFVPYTTMVRLLSSSHNPDYFAEGLPRQTAQRAVKQTVTDMSSYFKACARYRAKPGAFIGKPELPGYKHKGGHCTAFITNQDCTIRKDASGMSSACFPFIKHMPMKIGRPQGRLKEVQVTPDNGAFKVLFVFDVDIQDPVSRPAPERIAAIDFGVNNLMSVTNNCGLPCLLYKGGIVKSVNRFYNKGLSVIMAAEMAKPDCPKNRKGAPMFRPTGESMALTREREDRLRDILHKTASHFIAWCVENRIDTIVAGENKGWKQVSSIGRTNNQSFVQIPFFKLRRMIAYRAEEHGIRYVTQEESYTSRASFLDMDPIPVYGEEGKDAVFSGKRRPTRYKGMYKKGGFRGLYQSSDGRIINADLNGSANILRKAYPDAFRNGQLPDFGYVCVIRNPEGSQLLTNRKDQASVSKHAMSRAKAKRLIRKLAS